MFSKLCQDNRRSALPAILGRRALRDRQAERGQVRASSGNAAERDQDRQVRGGRTRHATHARLHRVQCHILEEERVIVVVVV